MGRRRDPVREADEKLQREGNRQAKLIHGAAATCWELSDRERGIIKAMERRSDK